jgi:DNA-binding transcriptional LysR family regulator
MAIKSLEEKLGSNLFIRSTKGVKLTSEGTILYSYLSQAIGLIDIAEQKHEEMLLLYYGEVTIGASDSIISGFLLPYLEKYNNLHNKITIKVINRTTDETLELLKTGSIDFGFVNLPIDSSENIDIIKCMTIHDCIVFGTKFKELLNKNFNIKDLSNYPLLMLKGTSNSRRLLDEYAKQQGLSLNPIIELDSTDLLIKFAKINLGIAFVIKEFAEPALDDMNLFELPLSPQIPHREIGLVKLKDIPLSHAANAFVKLLLSSS